MSKSVVVDEVCRVEGHGGITVALQNGKVSEVKFDIFEGSRFFEPLLKGRPYDEVASITSRICAICSFGVQGGAICVSASWRRRAMFVQEATCCQPA